ncbi:hypothetical protein EVG20_g4734 [Dentipellis fragilis]|uniref:Uncharacterized protein n=1 Tax=Dentipellis fragilis TaxID=205917 RepID=A0A4Y9YXQ3_9AGAM|nr:hypothetical protein EVG20_g4734 [Dentipellis fragilis]
MSPPFFLSNRQRIPSYQSWFPSTTPTFATIASWIVAEPIFASVQGANHAVIALKSFREELLADSELAARNSALSRWILKWQPMILNAAVDALNLPNNLTKDYLATHSIVIEIGKRPDPPNRSISMAYEVMLRGRVMTNDKWVQEMINRGASDEHIEGWRRDNRGLDVARIIIICGDLLRFLYFSLLRLSDMKIATLRNC